MSENRFQYAVSSARPPRRRVIEAYSPKLGRRLQCFGEHVFEQWVRLEADPTVQAFCERPVYLDRAAMRLVDFWVMQEGREALLIVDTEGPASLLGLNGVELPVHSIPCARTGCSACLDR